MLSGLMPTLYVKDLTQTEVTYHCHRITKQIYELIDMQFLVYYVLKSAVPLLPLLFLLL